MNLDEKLERVSRQFCIDGTYVGQETICVGNVNKTYEARFLQPDGSPKSYLIQNVNTYAFRKPIELMENIDKVTEHIRAKTPDRSCCIIITPVTPNLHHRWRKFLENDQFHSICHT